LNFFLNTALSTGESRRSSEPAGATDPAVAVASRARSFKVRRLGCKRLLNAASDNDDDAIFVAESKEQAALIGSPNQFEAIRAGMEGRPGRFAD